MFYFKNGIFETRVEKNKEKPYQIFTYFVFNGFTKNMTLD